ncbi:hypothetical protein ACEK07_44520 [Alcanivoracaceae bacterium MT1]
MFDPLMKILFVIAGHGGVRRASVSSAAEERWKSSFVFFLRGRASI